jgi:hypothetical protein
MNMNVNVQAESLVGAFVSNNCKSGQQGKLSLKTLLRLLATDHSFDLACSIKGPGYSSIFFFG